MPEYTIFVLELFPDLSLLYKGLGEITEIVNIILLYNWYCLDLFV